ncbi:MAG: hypothetical protein ACW975_14205 [Candidatus Thorarchaeota archaeon]
MTKIEPAEDIVPRILEQYSERPRGWRVMTTPRGEMLVVGPDSAFQLKLISLNPFEFVGSGMEVKDTSSVVKSVRSTPEFGFRPLTETDIQGLVAAFGNPLGMQSKLRKIIQRAPVSSSELGGSSIDHILSGPVLTRPDFSSLGGDVRKLQDQLDKSAMNVFRKRYPMRAGMYF